jgi:hypothetical protein
LTLDGEHTPMPRSFDEGIVANVGGGRDVFSPGRLGRAAA